MKKQQMPGAWDSWDNRHTDRWRMAGRWRNDVVAVLLLLGLGLLINHSLKLEGLCMEDLKLWSCYGELPFWRYLFSQRNMRFLYYLAVWLELKVVGPHIGWIVPIHILLHVGIGFTLYRMGRNFSRSSYVGALCGFAFLVSWMSYSQIGQLSGLGETIALWMAVGILYWLCCFFKDTGGRNYRTFYGACGLYFGICFVHERYQVLLLLFYWVLLCRKVKNRKLWAIPSGIGGAVQAVRLATSAAAKAGQALEQGPFSFRERIETAIRQGAYLFGIHTGPEFLSGPSFRDAPLGVMLLIAAADLMLAAFLVAFFAKVIQEWKHCGGYLCISLLFIGFVLCGVLGSGGAYVSFAAGLLYLSWMYGALTEKMVQEGTWMQAVSYLAMLSFYVVLMLPSELYYRSFYPELSFMPIQQQYNSLAEETYGAYGDGIFGKTIYIIGNRFGMDDFTENTFLKVFDREQKAEGTRLVHVEDIREIGLVSSDMLVLQEDPDRNQYQDVTRAMRQMKCRGIYGYYEDGWMDEQAMVQVMAGASGVIEMEFFYPGEVQNDQWITIYVNGQPEIYLEMDQNPVSRSIQTVPYQTITLEFRTNFHLREVNGQRGETRLAAILTLRAD